MGLGSIVNNHLPVVSNPKSGTFSRTYTPFGSVRLIPDSYTHRVEDIGGFVSCKFDLIGDLNQLFDIFNKNILTEIKSYNHQGLLGWEGVITALRLVSKTQTYFISADDLVNFVFVKYSLKGIPNEKTSAAENVDSQNNYGLLEKAHQLDRAVTLATSAEAIRDTQLLVHGNPYSRYESIDTGDPSLEVGQAKLSVTCSGYKWYLERRTYANKVKESQALASTVITDINTADGQFTQTATIETNSTPVLESYDIDQVAWEIMSEVARPPDGSDNPFTLGYYDNRELVYAARKESTVDNIGFTKDHNGVIKDRTGRKIEGMTLRPNGWIRNLVVPNNPGVAYSNINDDLQVMYMAGIMYSERDKRASITNQAKNSLATQLENVVFKRNLGI